MQRWGQLSRMFNVQFLQALRSRWRKLQRLFRLLFVVKFLQKFIAKLWRALVGLRRSSGRGAVFIDEAPTMSR